MASAATIGLLRAMMTMDTSNFDAGARKAAKGTKGLEKEIEGLTKEVAKLTPQAERMVKAFGGDRLLHQANNLTAAVNKLGGAQKLTAAEQTKVNRTLTDALEKYKALGQKAPAEMVKLEAATRKTSDATGAFNTRMVALGAAAGTMAAQFAGQALRAVINMGRAAVDSAGMILDLSKSTGLSTKTIQQMQFVAEQTGSSLETFTGAAFRLGMRLSGGGNSVQKAVEALGLEFEKVRAMKPDQQWDVITAALGRMENAQKRNELGVVLMGKTFAGVATAIGEGYKQIADEATLSSDAQIRALEQAGDAWDKFKNRQHTNVRSILGDLVVLGTEFQKAGFFEKLAALGSGIGAGPNAVAGLFTNSLNVGAKKPAAPGATPPAVVSKSAVQQLADIRKELAALTPDNLVELNAELALGVKSASELEDQFGLSDGALRLYNAATKEGATRTKELEKDSKALAKSQAELAKETENAARAWLDMLGKMERDELQRVADARRADVLADIGFQMAGIEGVVDRAGEARDKLDERDAKWRAHRNEMGERMLEEEGARIAQSEARWQQYYQTVANIFLGLVDAAAGSLGTLIFGTGADNGAQQAAEDAAESYERLKASGVASAEAITRAFQDMRRAEAAAQDSFADRLKSVWDGIRRYLVDVLNQILNYFVHSFLEGMIKAIVGSKLSQTLGQAIIGGVGGATGGVGGIAQVAGGAILPSVLGGGAAAGGVLASGSIAGASAASIPAIASAGSSVSLAAGTSAGAVGGGGAGGLGMIGALASNPITWGVAAGLLLTWGIKSKGWLRGGEEGVQVNPRRGRFIGQFGPPGTGPESGFHTLAAILTSITKKPGGGPAMAALNAADTVREFESAQATIVGILGRNGRNVRSFSMGGFVQPGAVVPAVLHGGRFGEVITPLRAPASDAQSPRVVHHHQINITSWDALDVRRGMKQIIKELKFEAQTNENGLVPAFSRAQGLA